MYVSEISNNLFPHLTASSQTNEVSVKVLYAIAILHSRYLIVMLRESKAVDEVGGRGYRAS